MGDSACLGSGRLTRVYPSGQEERVQRIGDELDALGHCSRHNGSSRDGKLHSGTPQAPMLSPAHGAPFQGNASSTEQISTSMKSARAAACLGLGIPGELVGAVRPYHVLEQECVVLAAVGGSHCKLVSANKRVANAVPAVIYLVSVGKGPSKEVVPAGQGHCMVCSTWPGGCQCVFLATADCQVHHTCIMAEAWTTKCMPHCK